MLYHLPSARILPRSGRGACVCEYLVMSHNHDADDEPSPLPACCCCCCLVKKALALCVLDAPTNECLRFDSQTTRRRRWRRRLLHLLLPPPSSRWMAWRFEANRSIDHAHVDQTIDPSLAVGFANRGVWFAPRRAATTIATHDG